ncbi:MAG: hypothetical protein FWG67_08580 [Defluviitaleaceae bacterium]|nr:hypothetical protein [Defluviitaleaceae bacterium]
MINFEILRYLKCKWIRILLVICLLFVTAAFSVQNVYRFLIMSELLTAYDLFTISDYIVGTFNSAQFMMYFILPVLFSILVADIISADLDENLDQFFFTRLDNRLSYVFVKIKMIILFAIVFTILFLAVLLITGSFYHISFTTNHHHYLFLANQRHHVWVYLYVASFFILGLILIGMIVVTLSIYLKNAGVSVGIIVLLGFMHNIFYVIGFDGVLAWLPFSQYLFGHRNYFMPFGLDVPYFTTLFSLMYMIGGSGILSILMTKKIRNMDIGLGKE